MKTYGMVVAIERELLAILKSDEIEYKKIQEKPFGVYEFQIGDAKIFVANSGAGIIDAALATQMLIINYGVDCILNYGVVGALNKDLKAGDLLVVKRTVKHDIDFSFEGVEKGVYPDVGEMYLYSSQRFSRLLSGVSTEVTLASGDAFIVDKKTKDYLRETFAADICDMEGAAIARTCYKYGKEFFMVKCISDTYDEGGVAEFDKYVKECGAKAFAFLLNIIKKDAEK